MEDYTTVVSLPARRDADPIPGHWQRMLEADRDRRVDFRHSATADPERTRLLVSVRGPTDDSLDANEVDIYNV